MGRVDGGLRDVAHEVDGGALDAAWLRAELWADAELDLGVVRMGRVVPWTLPVRVIGWGIDLEALRIELVGGEGWILEAPAVFGRAEAETEFAVRGTAFAEARRDLEATIVLTHPEVARAVRVRLRAVLARDPTALFDPEDIGFGAIELNVEAEITAHFSAPIEALSLPAAVIGDRITTPNEPWVDGIRLRFVPTTLGSIDSASLTVRGRRIPIDGRGVERALRVLPAQRRLADQPSNGCRQARFSVGNPGVGFASDAPLNLYVSGPIRAEWVEELPAGPLAPLEARSVTALVCATGRGPFTIGVGPDRTDWLLSGRARGAELIAEVAPSNADLSELIVGLSRRVEVQVHNPGQLDLRLDRIESQETSGGSLTVVSPMVPMTIAPGRTATVSIELVPTGSGRGSILFHSNDRDRPTVDLTLAWSAEPRPCQMSAPSSLRLGMVVGPRAKTALVLSNVGESVCAVLVPRVLPAAFEWEDAIVGEAWDSQRWFVEVEPGTSEALPIVFEAPGGGPFNGTMALEISRGQRPADRPNVALGAETAAEGLVIDVRSSPPCISPFVNAANFEVEFKVQGPRPVEVFRMELRSLLGEAFTGSLPEPPFTLRPGETVTGTLRIENRNPNLHAGLHAAELDLDFFLASSRLRRQRRERLVADFSSLRAFDRFTQPGRTKLDLLIAVDDSASMADIDQVDRNIEELFLFISAEQIDTRWLFISIDAAGPAVVVPPGDSPAVDTLDLSAEAAWNAILRRLELARAQSRDSLEQPMDAVRRAVGRYAESGFLRSDAFLSILVISDDDDASPGSVDEAYAYLASVHGDEDRFAFSAVTSVPSSRCEAPRTAEAAPRLIDFVGRGSGVSVDICQSLWRGLFASDAWPLVTRFFLTQQPVIDSLRLFINGVEVPEVSGNGTVLWGYDFVTNSIFTSVFGTPPPGAEVEVSYVAGCQQ